MSRSRTVVAVLACAAALSVLTGCAVDWAGAGTVPSSATSTEQRYPDVRAVDIRRAEDGTYTLDVTISSPYDTAERYADGWRVLDQKGEVLGTHHLSHDHASEQPFTRTMTGLVVPNGVTRVTVQARDLLAGYGGATVTVAVPRS